jgi:hypothetical protein
MNEKVNNKKGCTGCLTMIIFIVAAIFIFKSCVFGGNKKEDTQDMTATIIADVKTEVNKKLKSPKSASYPWGYDQYNIKEEDGATHEGFKRYTVKSYVDADNSFGASIRTNFVVVLEVNKDNYYSISVDLKE